jgi:hypothetical protein
LDDFGPKTTSKLHLKKKLIFLIESVRFILNAIKSEKYTNLKQEICILFIFSISNLLLLVVISIVFLKHTVFLLYLVHSIEIMNDATRHRRFRL